jgi:O-6-methylguanine DNA methyltransferase
MKLEFAIATQEGDFIACFSERGLCVLRFPDDSPPKSNRLSPPTGVGSWLKMTEAALKAVLSGQKPAEFPPFDLSEGTAFQQAVWQAMSHIPTGQVQTYGELAAAIGKPKAVRAVGAACGANPIPVLIPCHRVIAAHGKLGGFSSGLHWKRRLLASEGVRLTFRDPLA